MLNPRRFSLVTGMDTRSEGQEMESVPLYSIVVRLRKGVRMVVVNAEQD